MAGRCQLGALDGPGPDAAASLRAPPPRADHPQGHGLVERRQIDQVDGAAVLDPRPAVAASARRARFSGLDDHDELAGHRVVDADHVDVGQSDQQLAHARRVDLQQGLLGLGWRRNH